MATCAGLLSRILSVIDRGIVSSYECGGEGGGTKTSISVPIYLFCPNFIGLKINSYPVFEIEHLKTWWNGWNSSPKNGGCGPTSLYGSFFSVSATVATGYVIPMAVFVGRYFCQGG